MSKLNLRGDADMIAAKQIYLEHRLQQIDLVEKGLQASREISDRDHNTLIAMAFDMEVANEYNKTHLACAFCRVVVLRVNIDEHIRKCERHPMAEMRACLQSVLDWQRDNLAAPLSPALTVRIAKAVES